MNWVLLVVSLIVILAGCELFTNGVEWFGKKLGLGEGAVGSVLAAIGTALPETLIPLIAIVFSGGAVGHQIGVGAILGAPFMLSTLAMFVTGISVVIFARRGRRPRELTINREVLQRDLSFFLAAYAAALLAGLINIALLRYLLAAGLVLAYGYYVYLTLKTEGDLSGHTRPLYFQDGDGSPHFVPHLGWVVLQIFVSLSAIIFGAELFVHRIEEIATGLHIPALIIALLIAPVATELPEKFNSVFWIRAGKDTLALGNITGAMVFQSVVPVSIGLLLTAWKLPPLGFLSGGLALFSGLFLLVWVRINGSLKSGVLMGGGLLYLTYLIYTISRIA